VQLISNVVCLCFTENTVTIVLDEVNTFIN
jgi:hypothetical protein